MTSAALKQALAAGRRVYGTLIVSPSPRWPDTIATLGLDFVFIDTEHIALGREQLSWMCQTYRARGLPPLVRIPSPDPYQACMALDGGAAGVIAPYVETVEQVQALRGAVKLRPLKGARLATMMRDPGAMEAGLADYLERNNRENVLIINVESTPALANLDALLSVPDVDAVLIGPHDLSCSLGIPECYDDPQFEAAVLRIARHARRRGVAAGIHAWMGVERFVRWGEAGFTFVIYSADILAMRDKLGSDIGELRARLGDVRASEAGADNF